jgi:hypothetical protein
MTYNIGRVTIHEEIEIVEKDLISSFQVPHPRQEDACMNEAVLKSVSKNKLFQPKARPFYQYKKLTLDF